MPEATKDAGIRWCLKNVLSSYSYRSSGWLAGLFRNMFPDSTIAEKFCLQRENCAYFINYGTAPHCRSLLVNNVKDSEFHARSFDKSLNTLIPMGQMDLVVDFWDNAANKVCTR